MVYGHPARHENPYGTDEHVNYYSWTDDHPPIIGKKQSNSTQHCPKNIRETHGPMVTELNESRHAESIHAAAAHQESSSLLVLFLSLLQRKLQAVCSFAETI